MITSLKKMIWFEMNEHLRVLRDSEIEVIGYVFERRRTPERYIIIIIFN